MSTLRYHAPASRWLECLPLGNGQLGAMLDGGLSTATIRLNDDTAWSGSPNSEAAGGLLDAASAADHLDRARTALRSAEPLAAAAALAPMQVPYSQAFLPFARLLLTRTLPEDPSYRRELDLASAVHHVRSGHVREETFVSAPHGVLVHRIEGTPLETIGLETPHHVIGRAGSAEGAELLVRLPADVAPTHEPDATPITWSDVPGAALEGAVVAGIHRDGTGTIVVVATETTYTTLGSPPAGDAHDAAQRARARVTAALALGWDGLAAAHAEDYRPRFDRVRIDLSGAESDRQLRDLPTHHRLRRAESHPAGPLAADPGLVSTVFDFGRYLLLSSARPGSLPPTLQGIWNDEMQPPWSSNYTLNINAQMNMWAAHPTALDECAAPFFDLIVALAQAGTGTAARLYGTRGWVAHHNSDAWLLSAPVGGGHGDARWTAWPFAAPWLVLHVLDAVEFGAIDDATLQRLWPAVRGAAAFVLDWVQPDGAGGWLSAPATSPENTYRMSNGGEGALDTTSTMDLTLAVAACHAAVRIGELLGVEDDVVRASRTRATELPAEPLIGADGAIVEWSQERTAMDPHHRHVSHLVGLYPGTARWSPAARRAAAVSLDQRGDESSGWSLVWKGLLWARLGRGDRVETLLRLLFRDAEALTGPFAGGLYPNMFAAHPPFQIDANLGMPALIAEAILQSHEDIELLPALPPSLHTGNARGLIARPGVIVDLAWAGGALTHVRLRARAGTAQVRIRWGGALVSRLVPSEGIELTADDFTNEGAGQRS
ncbi:glycosyl hydrolase family 95 catalytic domain-containing protein [Ruania halotolerans]|uniref:glycosyl hydrolase family 95 catalytic domain-containing protein n=1 Tax=Ruania halotolerans TaxID=2897773 RepID=UPI001E5E1114|nr:glycoside hydrolase N-terminal domain-containing protein [Ruania halotolerans]UFU05691.1 glycoside hydrolase family 95 protein [Ruania halotolerans]